MPTHAHVMTAGRLMSAVLAFFHHLVPAARLSRLAAPHFWLTAASGLGLLAGLRLLIGGHQGVEPLVAASSPGFHAALVLFAVIALPAVWQGEARPSTVGGHRRPVGMSVEER